jgi:uncharacterized RDD family membrane protein YckC
MTEASFEPKVIFHNTPIIADRIKSALIDSVVLVGLMFTAFYALSFFGIESGLVKGALFVLVFLYEPIMVSFSQTIGQRFIGIRVVEQKTEENTEVKSIGFLRSIARYIVKLILGVLSLVTINFDEQSRAIHDKFVRSIVIRA